MSYLSRARCQRSRFPHLLDQVFANGQPKTDAVLVHSCVLFQLVEVQEEFGLTLLRHSAAVISDDHVEVDVMRAFVIEQ